MKKITLIILILFILALSTPASAAHEVPPMGEKIWLLPAYYDPYPPVGLTFSAGSPFYIQHGWCWEPGNTAIGRWDFRINIDGVPVEGGKRIILASGCGENGQFGSVTHIYNFPMGLSAGAHTFEGFWISTCGNTPGCEHPNEPIIGLYSNITITFTEPDP